MTTDEQRAAAAALVGKRVQFHHEPGDSAPIRVVGAHAGMVILDGYAGQFAPGLFRVVEESDAG